MQILSLLAVSSEVVLSHGTPTNDAHFFPFFGDGVGAVTNTIACEGFVCMP